MSLKIRDAAPADMDAIAALNDAAFGTPDEGVITRQLARDGDSLVSLDAEDETGTLIGHIEFFRILVNGKDVAAGLGPMSAAPGHQKQGVGYALIKAGMPRVEQLGRQLVFVLGHPDYYPRFGFHPAVAARYKAPWSGEAFMAIELFETAPRSGTLTYPRAFMETV
ncbi:GNAT family N-acetyltransferase [Henriciella marina]|uniref:N-acetyltransferase n=1 Tax=Henriciella marina TaxID=453851 RepID=A0ABT4LTJ4_9PROT|nr:N-acetyltransferase [Henriciella marina]MCZ4297684.1 N-acetyltransferase [Henriciella marina]